MDLGLVFCVLFGCLFLLLANILDVGSNVLECFSFLFLWDLLEYTNGRFSHKDDMGLGMAKDGLIAWHCGCTLFSCSVSWRNTLWIACINEMYERFFTAHTPSLYLTLFLFTASTSFPPASLDEMSIDSLDPFQDLLFSCASGFLIDSGIFGDPGISVCCGRRAAEGTSLWGVKE